MDEIEAPFAVRRVYWLYGCNAPRGGHSHRKLQQIVTCPVGSCVIDLETAENRWTVTLDKPSDRLFIGPDTWRVLRDFSPDCVVVVLASEPYDESDYIRDYDVFLSERQG